VSAMRADLVLTGTGDLVTQMSREEAVAFVAYIREQQAELPRRVAEAYAGRAWVALGYPSWEAMCEAEGLCLRLPRDERPALVLELTGAGLSTRAIAPIVGVTHMTVQRDLAGGTNVPPDRRSSGVQNRTPEDAPLTGRDGKSYRRPTPKPPPPTPDPDAQRALALEQSAIGLIEAVIILRGITDHTVDHYLTAITQHAPGPMLRLLGGEFTPGVIDAAISGLNEIKKELHNAG
jgi:hypothetical protein